MNPIFEIFPIKINPFLLFRLESNLDALVLFEILIQYNISEQENYGYNLYSREDMIYYTGLTENKIKKSETFLKKKNLLSIKNRNKNKYFKIDYETYKKLLGYSVTRKNIYKLDNNSKATYLLSFIEEYYNIIGDELPIEIPSKLIESLSGLNNSSQIYARDSLLSYNLLSPIMINNNKSYVININNYSRILDE